MTIYTTFKPTSGNKHDRIQARCRGRTVTRPYLSHDTGIGNHTRTAKALLESGFAITGLTRHKNGFAFTVSKIS